MPASAISTASRSNAVFWSADQYTKNPSATNNANVAWPRCANRLPALASDSLRRRASRWVRTHVLAP